MRSQDVAVQIAELLALRSFRDNDGRVLINFYAFAAVSEAVGEYRRLRDIERGVRRDPTLADQPEPAPAAALPVPHPAGAGAGRAFEDEEPAGLRSEAADE